VSGVRFWRRQTLWRGLVLATALALGACGGREVLAPVDDASGRQERGPEATVVKGDTLYALAWRYGYDYRDLARWNNLQPPYLLVPGQRLRLVPADESPTRVSQGRGAVIVDRRKAPASAPAVAKVTPAPAPAKTATQPQPVASAKAPPTKAGAGKPPPRQTAQAASKRKVSGHDWQWPVNGQILAGFGSGNPGITGIDIAGTDGDSVRAAAEGKVVYRGSGLPGYGQLIIVKHSDTLLSAYGYLGQIRVQEGQRVKGGEVIADLGTGGKYRQPVVHFEIRREGNPVDPVAFLPS